MRRALRQVDLLSGRSTLSDENVPQIRKEIDALDQIDFTDTRSVQSALKTCSKLDAELEDFPGAANKGLQGQAHGALQHLHGQEQAVRRCHRTLTLTLTIILTLALP